MGSGKYFCMLIRNPNPSTPSHENRISDCLSVPLPAIDPLDGKRRHLVCKTGRNRYGQRQLGQNGGWPPTQLATIIAGAASGDQVWVVGSTTGTTYYPTTGTSRTVAFVLKKRGSGSMEGFAGTETALGQQDPAIYITILSGDIGVVGNNATDNS